jgi:putative restriction endonuclease
LSLSGAEQSLEDVLHRLTHLRQYTESGRRAPHKPLLVLLALAKLESHGTSSLDWSSEVRDRLGALLDEFGTSKSSPAYPFTRLRSDRVWQLSREGIANDNLADLNSAPVAGSFTPDVERALRDSPSLRHRVAHTLITQQFPDTLSTDILLAVGLPPERVLHERAEIPAVLERRRHPGWRDMIIEAWDRQCAFCCFDGSLRGAAVGIDAAHVRWFTFDGPDDRDNGLALCALHHRLFDRGALGLSDPETVIVSTTFSARTQAGRATYDLHGLRLRPRPGTPLPHVDHVTWHTREVFKGPALSA